MVCSELKKAVHDDGEQTIEKLLDMAAVDTSLYKVQIKQSTKYI